MSRVCRPTTIINLVDLSKLVNLNLDLQRGQARPVPSHLIPFMIYEHILLYISYTIRGNHMLNN